MPTNDMSAEHGLIGMSFVVFSTRIFKCRGNTNTLVYSPIIQFKNAVLYRAQFCNSFNS